MLESILNDGTSPDPAEPGEYTLKQTANNQTVQWRVPDGVFSICCVCVGHGTFGGGGLSWRNNISVSPGELLDITFTVATTTTGSNGATRLLRGTAALCIAYAGATRSGTAEARPVGGFGGKSASPVNDGGGNGGAGHNYPARQGGGGAGGYLGNGGNCSELTATSTAGAVGSGSGSGARNYSASFVQTIRQGGNVGLFGIGITGASATNGGMSNGNFGSPGAVMCGGGDFQTTINRYGGGIRIIWGEGYSYPSDAIIDP